jgi:hypothetical protein
VSDTPAGRIRRYLDEHEGEIEVPYHNLLTTWGSAGSSGVRMTDDLAAAGIATEPPLAGLGRDDRVHLRVVEGVAARSPAGPQSPSAGDGAAGAPRWLVVGSAVFVLAVGSGVGAYFIGKASGEDLDAARAAGDRQGQREGAARGTKVGYDQGYKEGRKAGYRQTYKKAYDRAKKTGAESAPTGTASR